MPSVLADALAAPALLDGVVAPSFLSVRGHAMVNVCERRWRRHVGGRVPDRPHIPPQCAEDVLAWKRNPAVVQDGERRVVVHSLSQELLVLEVILSTTICSSLWPCRAA